MADWSLMEREWQLNPYDPYQYSYNEYFQDFNQPPPLQQPYNQTCMQPAIPVSSPAQILEPPNSASLVSLLHEPSTSRSLQYQNPPLPILKQDNPREIRNKAEKQRRDKLNRSIGELASMVPPVLAASRKIDKTGVLRLTAHYLRSHQYVFGDSIAKEDIMQFSAMSSRALLSILNGFLLTTTYKGLIVVVSQNVQQYLGYTELDLLGQNIFNLIHEEDRQLMKDMLMPKPHLLGPNGELLVPDEPEGKNKIAELLAKDKRRFIVRFKKLCQRSEPCQYATCHIEGSLRKSDRACNGYNRCCQMVRRARARGDNPCNSGNDVVFVGIVRLATETFLTESNMESYRMEYRTRHSIDGQIIQSEHRISLVTGYMTHEVNGVNAMNFMHRDDVRWVVIALRQMYDQHRLIGESCYRLLAKNGQFIYLKTRGRLDVDPSTRAVTSFVCTNTVVDEKEGMYLIKTMKKKFMLMVNNVEEPLPEEEVKDANDQNSSIEDPRQLEKVILHLVTNLPSPHPSDEGHGVSPNCMPSSGHLAIIPPKKERIVSAIEKIYSVINHIPNEMENVRISRRGKIDTTDSSNVPNDNFTTFHESPTSQSSQLAIEPKHSSTFTWNTENPYPKLPDFSKVYQRRNTDSNGSIDLNLTLNNTSITTRDDILPTGETTSGSCMEMTTIRLGNTTEGIKNKRQENTIEYVRVTQTGNKVVLKEGHDTFPGAKISGIKRPIDCSENTETEAIVKKKNASDDVFLGQNAPSETSPLDTLFDEELFNMSFSQIDNSINLDPSFPDLLVSQEVQDLLQEIEDGSTGNHNSKSGI